MICCLCYIPATTVTTHGSLLFRDSVSQELCDCRATMVPRSHIEEFIPVGSWGVVMIERHHLRMRRERYFER